MGALKRQPGHREYITLGGMIKTSKKGISLHESKNLQTGKQRRWEKKIARKEVTPRFMSAGAYGPLTYRIFFGDMEVGFIRRGHALVGMFRRKGIFLKALRQMEEGERRLFSRSWAFEGYKSLIVDQMARENSGTHQMWDFLAGLKTPAHIDYTSYPATACGLLAAGYSLAPQSVRELQKNGLREGAGWRETIKFLKSRPKLGGKFIFLATKPMAID